jgi:hypothetical protein
MLTGLIFATLMQAAAPGAVVWQTDAPPQTLASAAPAPSTLPDWAVADPFAWERSQCSPLVRRDPSLEVCQARVRGDLAAALGDRLPPALTPAGVPVPCAPAKGDDGDYPVQCGAPERQTAQTAAPQDEICESRPSRQGNSVAFVNECRPAGQPERQGLSIKLFGDRD